MFLAKVSINRPVLTTVGILIFLIFGLIAYNRLNLNLQPDVEIPFVTVQTIYPGAGPKEIETLITKRIEDAISTISQIERIESYSLDGASIIIIEFQLGKDVNVANQETKDKVDEIINELPTDAKKPIVQKVDLRLFPVVDVVLSGNLDSRQLYEIADKTLKDRFSQIDGVAKVQITGGQEREIRVQLDNKVVFENNISLPQLTQILRMHNMDIPGGYFQIGNQEYTVRLDGQFQNPESIRELEIPTAFGPKKIRQIADVIDSGKDVRQRATFFNVKKNLRNESVVRLGIIKSSEGNVVKVADAIRTSLPEIQAALPEGCKLEIVNDASEFVKASVDDTMSNIYLGVIFTAIVLFLFLHDWRSTLVVAMSMPTSIISTFLLLQMFGLSLNMMTLMGLSVSVGVLVANSIVVIENIFRFKKMGETIKQASFKGTSEVTVAVLASTLTNIVVFLPIANMSSMVGLWLRELALAAVFATIFSLIMSFTLTPLLSSLILSKEHKTGRLSNWFNNFEVRQTEIYRKLLGFVLQSKFRSLITVAGAIIIFILVVIIFGPKLGFEFIPQTDDGRIRITVELPAGYNLEETAGTVRSIEERIRKHKEVKHILTNLGKLSDLDVGTNMASIDVKLVDVKERDLKLLDAIPLFTKDLADIPNAKIKVDVGEDMGGGEAPIQFFLLGQDLEELERLKDETVKKLKDVPGLINFDNSSRAGKPEITVYPKREKLTEVGMTITDLAFTLRSAIEGIQSAKYREAGDEYDITVTLDDESVNTPEKIGNITVATQFGSFRLAQLADVKFTTGFTKILHRDKFTSIMFTGSAAPGYPLGDVTSEIEKRFNEINLPSGYSFRWGGNVKMMNDMIQDMIFAFFLAVLLTYMLLAAILESFWQPVIIMFTVLLGLLGVILALFITNTSFSITSLMAIIMLIGIVVNNAILILDYTNQLRREQGYLPKDALMEACPTKLKPQIMASIAIILGMLPLALGIGDAGKEIRMPLGIVAIGGLLASTILTLFVIPAIYNLTSRAKFIDPLSREKVG
ncbi:MULTISPECIES: efflux RND transporter permease subunit [Ignavibacterium]|jgi:HAE1 family hydrophobic/amphiphilic exporter-1|uniref:efflux RND transporter permease subunit n=1 Tax=Ignavibacterium TaxID=795750 RepID=UPI0025BAFB68|nr:MULTISPECIES: efflux RND transporter permease subunit [Ignavibacterium]MBI5661853.1 efflux RND transporter permease subunit [Ignavibacterium album]